MRLLSILAASLALAITVQAQNAQQNNQQNREPERSKPAPQAPPNTPAKGWVMTAPPPAATSDQSSGGHQHYNHTQSYSDSAQYYSPYYTPNGSDASPDANAYATNRASLSADDATAQDVAADDDRSAPWEPSTYMDYDKAVELGKEQQAAAAPTPQSASTIVPLGDVARNLRKAKDQPSATKPLIRQTSEGKLEVCKPDGTACHPPA